MGRNRIERGIYAAPDGQYDVIVARRTGEKATTKPFRVRDFDEARNLRDLADETRRAGGDVEDAWGPLRDEIAKKTAAKYRTVAEAVDQYLIDREELMTNSDHSISGLTRNVTSLRPPSYDTEKSILNAHIKKRRGDLQTRALDSGAVGRLMTELAGARLGFRTQERVLGILRQLILAQPQEARPADFPWPNQHPVPPNEPLRRRPDPEVWNGRPGAAPPAVRMSQAVNLARQMRAAARIVIYLMIFLGLRRGESMGIQLRDFEWEEDRLWLKIRRQRSLKNGKLHDWLKSGAAHRDLPLPRMLEEYVLAYLERYHHGFVIGSDGAMASRYLAVTSTGRAVDGSFMRQSPVAFMNWFNLALARAALTFEILGYTLTPHHFRRSFTAYLMYAPDLLVDLGQPPSLFSIAGARISAWLGHQYKGEGDDAPASPITLYYGDRSIGDERRPLVQIADLIDVFMQAELPEGLLDDPDEFDLATVIRRDDKQWVLMPTAAATIGITPGALQVAIGKGTITSQLVYFADGNNLVPGRRHVVLASEVAQLADRARNLSAVAAFELLRLDRKAVTRLVERGLLTRHSYREGSYSWYQRAEVAKLLAILLRSVLTVLSKGGSLTRVQVRERMKELARRDPELWILIPYPKALRQSQVDYWLDLLLEGGDICRNSNGSYRIAERRNPARTAAVTVALREGPKSGCDPRPKKAVKVKRRPGNASPR